MSRPSTLLGDPDLDESIARLRREQTWKKSLVVFGLVAAFLITLVVTMLMYVDTPSEQPPARIGVEAFE